MAACNWGMLPSLGDCKGLLLKQFGNVPMVDKDIV